MIALTDMTPDDFDDAHIDDEQPQRKDHRPDRAASQMVRSYAGGAKLPAHYNEVPRPRCPRCESHWGINKNGDYVPDLFARLCTRCRGVGHIGVPLDLESFRRTQRGSAARVVMLSAREAFGAHPICPRET